MTDHLRVVYAALKSLEVYTRHRMAGDERGEGVISAAIAVLIMAFLGALMWVGFKAIFQDAQSNTQQQVDQIGR